ncbi:hypothetical protein GX645_07295 [Candidatus Sumerlaeota bacterium]|nr:hypothetical protein [Candidatus Sumerlaeota bacterium]
MGLFGRRKREVKKSPTSSRPDYMSIEPSTINDPAERKKLIQKQLRYLNALVMHKNTYHPPRKEVSPLVNFLHVCCAYFFVILLYPITFVVTGCASLLVDYKGVTEHTSFTQAMMPRLMRFIYLVIDIIVDVLMYLPRLVQRMFRKRNDNGDNNKSS